MAVFFLLESRSICKESALILYSSVDLFETLVELNSNFTFSLLNLSCKDQIHKRCFEKDMAQEAGDIAEYKVEIYQSNQIHVREIECLIH